MITHKTFTFLFLLFFIYTGNAYAACTLPNGNEGNLRYDSVSKKMQYCDGTNWLEMGVETQFLPISVGNSTFVADGSSDNGCTPCPAGYSLISSYVEGFLNDTDDQVIYNYNCYQLAGNLCYFIKGHGGVGGGAGKVRCGGLCRL